MTLCVLECSYEAEFIGLINVFVMLSCVFAISSLSEVPVFCVLYAFEDM